MLFGGGAARRGVNRTSPVGWIVRGIVPGPLGADLPDVNCGKEMRPCLRKFSSASCATSPLRAWTSASRPLRNGLENALGSTGQFRRTHEQKLARPEDRHRKRCLGICWRVLDPL